MNSQMTRILLIDNYDSFTYNLVQAFQSEGADVLVYRNDKIDIESAKNIEPTHIVISPGPGNPDQAGQCLKIVEHFYKIIPILGVCLGHQIIGQVFKSKIIGAKKLMHGKTSLITHNGKGIFRGIKKVISATRYHSLIIDKKSLGKDLVVTAQTKDKIIMGIMHNKYNVHGVQFHPESINTPEGMKLLKNFLNY